MTHRTPDEIRAREDARRARAEAEDARYAAELAADPWEIFRAVADRYRDKFGTVPDTWRIDLDRLPVLAEAMEAAMRTGRRLSVNEASKITGCTPLPLGTVG